MIYYIHKCIKIEKIIVLKINIYYSSKYISITNSENQPNFFENHINVIFANLGGDFLKNEHGCLWGHPPPHIGIPPPPTTILLFLLNVLNLRIMR